jgi:hypothetical protein
MKSILKFKLFTLYLCIAFTSCGQADPITPTKQYESCCGTEAVETTFSNGEKLFAPNAFTPNKDGLNDYWFPTFSRGQEHILAVLIYTLEKDTLIHKIEEFGIYPKGTYGWDGTRTKENGTSGDWKIHKGGFRYEIYFLNPPYLGSPDKFTFTGNACAIACDKDAEYFKEKEGCFYPIQSNSDGTLNKEIKVDEGKCFGN